MGFNTPSLFAESSHIFDESLLILDDLALIHGFRHLDQLAVDCAGVYGLAQSFSTGFWSCISGFEHARAGVGSRENGAGPGVNGDEVQQLRSASELTAPAGRDFWSRVAYCNSGPFARLLPELLVLALLGLPRALQRLTAHQPHDTQSQRMYLRSTN